MSGWGSWSDRSSRLYRYTFFCRGELHMLAFFVPRDVTYLRVIKLLHHLPVSRSIYTLKKIKTKPRHLSFLAHLLLNLVSLNGQHGQQVHQHAWQEEISQVHSTHQSTGCAVVGWSRSTQLASRLVVLSLGGRSLCTETALLIACLCWWI